MPRQVDMVPNPWLPYMDGHIWEFEEAEIRSMPGWHPMTNYTGEVCGIRQIQWVIQGKYYVRFLAMDDRRSPEALAGWKADDDARW